jgi:hypothetical protein
MRLNPHLQFDGQCEAAFKFYAVPWWQDRDDDDLRRITRRRADASGVAQENPPYLLTVGNYLSGNQNHSPSIVYT